MSSLDTLISQVEGASEWPPRSQQSVTHRVRLRRAFRQSDEHLLREYAGWDRWWRSNYGARNTRDYVTDPLPGLVSRAFADLLFGEDPVFKAAAISDQAQLDEIIESNCLPSELHRAEQMCSSEGEVWWRIYVDHEVQDTPLIQFVSRLHVIPLMHGQRVLAAAFISVIGQTAEGTVYRHIEYQADGISTNVLYQGTRDQLGHSIGLDSQQATTGLTEEWRHGLPILAGRVLNKLDDDSTLGRSDYQGVERMFLALNEAACIAAENARLTAKKRLFVAGALTQDDGSLNVGEDIVQINATDGELGDAKTPPIREVEYSFDAEAMIAYTSDLTDKILTRVGVAPELVGRDTRSGRAESGTALRTRLLHSVLAAQGKARYWDDALPAMLALAQQVDALPDRDGGFARSYTKVDEPPSVERASVLPHDDLEEAQRLALLAGAELISRETAVRELHDDWDDSLVTSELHRIEQDTASAAPLVPPGGDHQHVPLGASAGESSSSGN